MNRPELFEQSVNTLLDAYNNNELVHNNCEYCAVGNLLAKPAEKLYVSNTVWSQIFYTDARRTKPKQFYNIDIKPDSVAHQLINLSGYTVEELMQIEFAFETANDKQDEQYKGLCAVLEVLKQIHEKEEVTEELNRLNKVYESKNKVDLNDSGADFNFIEKLIKD